MPSSFRRLIAYQRAVELAHELHSAVEHWPILDRRGLVPQGTSERIDDIGKTLNGLIRSVPAGTTRNEPSL